MPQHKRDHVHRDTEERRLKRIRVTTATLLRGVLGLPLDPTIQNPLPVSREEVVRYFQEVAALPGPRHASLAEETSTQGAATLR